LIPRLVDPLQKAAPLLLSCRAHARTQEHAVTDAQVKQVVKAYQERLEREGYRAAQIDFDRTTAAFPRSRQLEHAAWMCTEVQKAIDAGERERAMRWFGFLQGVLWAHGIYAVNELREQNRAVVRG
jgi:hypothetical protein